MNKLLKELLLLALAIVPLLYLAIIWTVLPEQIPTHFDIAGKANGWSGKNALILIFALMGFGTYLLMLAIPHIDPKKKINEMGNKYYSLRVILALLMAVIAVFLTYTAKEGSMKNPTIFFGILGGFFAIMGNYMQTVRPNYFVGIRTPWTLESEDVWKKTHKMSGRLWMFGGIVVALLGFFIAGNATLAIMLAVIFVLMGIAPIVYSYIVYKHDKKLIKQ